MHRLAWSLLLGAFLLLPAPAWGQLFFASRPDPPFTIGPLMVRATVREGATAVPIVVSWSLLLTSGKRPADVAQDLFLLWPGEIRSEGGGDGKPDPTLARYPPTRGST